jgi:alpha-D-xyloside xylohydrolase
MQMDWSSLELIPYLVNAKTAKGLICLPSDNLLHEISCTGGKLDKDPLAGKVKWQVRLPK